MRRYISTTSKCVRACVSIFICVYVLCLQKRYILCVTTKTLCISERRRRRRVCSDTQYPYNTRVYKHTHAHARAHVYIMYFRGVTTKNVVSLRRRFLNAS